MWKDRLEGRMAWRRRLATGMPFAIIISVAILIVVFLLLLGGGRASSRAASTARPTPPPAIDPGKKAVFQSPLAGQWYDADKDRLSAQLDDFLAQADTAPLENVHALIVPHAGYRYSGPVAAFAYKQLAGKTFNRVIVMGPSHRTAMRNAASVPEATHYATPLGETPLDVDFIAALKQYPPFSTVPGADDREHSVQIQLPFLQKVLGDFAFVPVVVGRIDHETAQTMARILSGLIDPETLIIASSDFTHYGTNYDYVPFTDNVFDNLKKLNMAAWDCIQRKDIAGFEKHIESTGDTICGECPIRILLSMLPSESEARLLHYDTSGRMMNDTTNSVSYLSIAFTGAWKKGKPMEPTASASIETSPAQPSLTDEEKANLLALARASLEGKIRNGRSPSPEELGIPVTSGMKQIMGAFVTLKINGQLRGCIGEIFPRRELYKAVIERAVDAGINDYRFGAVTAAELPLLRYEISALTQPRPIGGYNEIVLGKHGIVIEKNGRSAVFLPQVAPEQGWDLPTTLTHLSMKAGLPGDAWKEGTKYTVFEAIVFHEKEQ